MVSVVQRLAHKPVELEMGVRLPSPTPMKSIIFDYYNTLYNPRTGKLFRGAIPLLEQLGSRFNLILITSGDNNRWQAIKELSLLPIFNQIILCKSKTKEVFSGFVNPETIIVGDRQDAEIDIGKFLGANILLVRPEIENPIKTIRKFLKP